MIPWTRPSFPPWTCELCSQEMDFLTGNLTKYFKIVNNFDLFFSFFTRNVLLTLEFQQIGTFWYIFSCLRGQTSTKFHKKSGWPCRGSQEGKKNKHRCNKLGQNHANLVLYVVFAIFILFYMSSLIIYLFNYLII